MKVIIDTAAGPGDAVAVLHALTDPAFEVLAITTLVDRVDPERATMTVGQLLAVAGARIPYASGTALPLPGTDSDGLAPRASSAPGNLALPAPLEPPLPDAVALAAEALLGQPPGSVTLLALAPLTNIARLARDHPEAYARLARIITMGGTVRATGTHGPPDDCNLGADPAAADLVLGAEVPVTLLPLELTHQLCATPADLTRLAEGSTPAARAAAALIAEHPIDAEHGAHLMNGPCLTLMAQAPVLFGCQPLQLRVDCNITPGRLLPDPTRPPIRVGTRIGAGSALDLLWSGLGAARATRPVPLAMAPDSLTPLPHDFWQVLESPGSWPSGPGTLHRDFWPATLPDGRQLRMPIRRLPGNGRRAVASLIVNQASFAVEDALTAAMAEIWAPLAPDVVIGVPGAALPLARGLARRLGHARMVPLGITRKLWYDPALSEQLRPITSPGGGQTVWLDPHLLPVLAGQRVLLVDDVARSGSSLAAVLRLLGRAGVTPAGIAVAMEQGDAWQTVLPNSWRLRGVFRAPVLHVLAEGFLEE